MDTQDALFGPIRTISNIIKDRNNAIERAEVICLINQG